MLLDKILKTVTMKKVNNSRILQGLVVMKEISVIFNSNKGNLRYRNHGLGTHFLHKDHHLKALPKRKRGKAQGMRFQAQVAHMIIMIPQMMTTMTQVPPAQRVVGKIELHRLQSDRGETITTSPTTMTKRITNNLQEHHLS